MNKGKCPTCGKIKMLTKHHILPKRFFGVNDLIFNLCAVCHIELEKIINNKELTNNGKLPVMQYIKIVLQFITTRGIQNNLSVEYLSKTIHNVLQSVRTYFYRN